MRLFQMFTETWKSSNGQFMILISFLVKNIHQMLGNSCNHVCIRVYSYVLCKSVKDLL